MRRLTHRNFLCSEQLRLAFGDDGVSAAYHGLLDVLKKCGLREWKSHLPYADNPASERALGHCPRSEQRYLAEISDTVRKYHADSSKQASIAREIQQLSAVQNLMHEKNEEINTLLGEKKKNAYSRESIKKF